MTELHKCIYFIVLFQVLIQSVLTEDATNSNLAEEKNAESPNGRRSGGMLIIDNSGNANGRVTSQKFQTKTYTTRVTSNSNTGVGGLQGWVAGSQNDGNVILQPQIQGIVQTQQGCGSGNVLANSDDQNSVIQKKSTVESLQMNGGNSLNSLITNENQWQSGQNGVRNPLVVGQLGGQSSLLHGTQVSTNNMNDVTGTIITSNNRGVNTLYEDDNIQKQENIFYPDNDSYKVSIISSGDGIYANELIGQQGQNSNVMVPDSNSANIIAVPVMRPKLGRFTIHGYRPNIQYYLKQIETNNILKNLKSILKVPSFIERIKPDQTNINLSEDQLNSYRQYLIQTGLIKLKPYQLIFSDQFRPKLRTLQWMVVPLDSNAEYCKQHCGGIFTRNTLYSTITENASKLPLKLLVPVLKVRTGLKKTVAGVQMVAGGVGDISGGMYRMMKDTPSHVAGLIKENDEESKAKS